MKEALEITCLVIVKVSRHIFSNIEPINKDLCKRLI